MKIQALARCVALLALISPFASADNRTKLSDAELGVLAHYHGVDQTEIMLGNLAQKRATRAAVKDYGAMLVKDHTANDKQLLAFAKQHKATIPANEGPLTAADADAATRLHDDIENLKTLKGVDFETKIQQLSVTAHEHELSKIDDSFSAVSTPELATMIAEMKPAFQHHADRARELLKGNAQASN